MRNTLPPFKNTSPKQGEKVQEQSSSSYIPYYLLFVFAVFFMAGRRRGR